MATKPAVGTRLINDAGTCVVLVDVADGQSVQPGEYPISRVDELLAAGYERVTKDHVIPLQAHEAQRLDQVKQSGAVSGDTAV